MPLSTVDWPGQLAATVFLRGCPWACSYCHNAHLQSAAAAEGDVAWAEVLAFLNARVGLLDAVVFSGGEPTMTRWLPDAMREVAAMGFAIGLHSGGPDPARFAAALTHADWVGFDVKAPIGEYERITNVAGSGEGALMSLRALVASGVPFEVRTTVHPELLPADSLARMADELEAEGVRRWVLQRYRPDGVPEGLPSPRAFDAGEAGAALIAALGERFTLAVR